jgi:hypothetical protein
MGKLDLNNFYYSKVSPTLIELKQRRGMLAFQVIAILHDFFTKIDM